MPQLDIFVFFIEFFFLFFFIFLYIFFLKNIFSYLGFILKIQNKVLNYNLYLLEKNLNQVQFFNPMIFKISSHFASMINILNFIRLPKKIFFGSHRLDLLRSYFSSRHNLYKLF